MLSCLNCCKSVQGLQVFSSSGSVSNYNMYRLNTVGLCIYFHVSLLLYICLLSLYIVPIFSGVHTIIIYRIAGGELYLAG